MASSNVIFSSIIIVGLCTFLSHVGAQKTVIELNEDNWTDMLKNEWMVEFYAPWCPACKALEEIWKNFATQSSALGIKVGKVNVITSPGLSGRFMVTALPTIFHVLNGEFRQYKGTRDSESFMTFIEEKKYEQVEPVPSWKSPNSLQMTIVSSFFKLSQNLRHILLFLQDLHNKMTEDFGLPTWGSYLIFAIATILMGAILGLVLVCLLDLIYPPKQMSVQSNTSAKKEKAKDSGDELADEDIRDDLIDDASQSDGGKHTDSDSDQNYKANTTPNKMKKRKPRRAD
ncbi:thioredoxin-related transmembrane protein 1-like isoform X1 [Harmonia axyridis]|uniref:thioredoxin-related transmembrane protein 1-like isoform X1 n=1 Tax=Harmonia axyridis TaxID=115357 RepID=UPI001E278DB7|nr:thioredoxin-related transmembrane protein 1-like isoform X1 [Harmonia axyridis]